MKLIYIYLENNYKNIPKGGYHFDDEFSINTFKITSPRKIELIRNKVKYHHPFNNSINNISCLVGKNGIGKTTFFELIITMLLWKLDESEPIIPIHFLFYDEHEDEFYIESYKDNSYYWNATLDTNAISIYKNTFKSFADGHEIKSLSGSRDWSVFPYQMNVIFHSLSPFDKIYTLLKKKLSGSSEQIEHYHRRFKYIGVNQIENEEVKYEYMTIINLINLFYVPSHLKMIVKYGYYFEKISFEINSRYSFNSLQLPEYAKFKGENKEYIDSYFDETTYSKIQLSYSGFISIINKELLNRILHDNLDISLPTKFIVFLYTLITEYKQKGITIDKSNILKYLNQALHNLINFNNIDFIRTAYSNQKINFITNLIDEQESYVELSKLLDKKELKIISNDGKLSVYLEYLKKLTSNDILEFSIDLIKLSSNDIVELISKINTGIDINDLNEEEVIQLKENGKEIDFLKLSSGEKTIFSYFSNLIGRLNDIYKIQATDSNYDIFTNKSFLILIDEVELHLHPEWQRTFIKNINDFFTFSDDSIKLQFIIASHSPFIVSDLYEKNIIYLGGNDSSTKTFAGNIFDIYKDDFYVSNTIGSFSEDIIKELSEILYILFALKKAKEEDNIFMLREYFNLMYETDDRDTENAELILELENFLYEKSITEKFEKISKNKYLVKITRTNELFYSEILKIINNIGEEVISEHLIKTHNYLVNEND